VIALFEDVWKWRFDLKIHGDFMLMLPMDVMDFNFDIL